MITKGKLNADPKRKKGITEREMTPAQRRKVAEIRQKMKDRNRRQLLKTGIKTAGNLEVTDNNPSGIRMIETR